MRSEQVRKLFLEFFREHGHTVVPSAPIVPINDPTLLFSNAGMNQFKDILIGKNASPYNPPRATSVQKCIRVSGKHNDLEEVGRDACHHTFFEMLGNWSFGDYFKVEAIKWAWELITEIYKLPKENLWAAVHESDDESAKIWEEEIGLPSERIVLCGDKDNFWDMADTGPCGPTTEIHFDWGEEIDPNGLPNSSKRFVEVWNIVFMQYFREKSGKLHPLPAKNVDTGLGFERLVAILQGTDDNYKTDIFRPSMDMISEISGFEYDEKEDRTMAFRELADHVRAVSFARADGALPSNTGRGYVLRRILRRAGRFSRILGVHDPMLYKLVTPLVDKMGDVYTELKDRVDLIARVIKSEEERFSKTLDFGLELFEKIVERVKCSQQTAISSEDAFKLYDTYGFPLDLTSMMAEEKGLTVDLLGFDELMSQQRKRARTATEFGVTHQKKEEWLRITSGSENKSLCYETESEMAEIRCLRALNDDKIEIVLSQTPFYAESGGQVGDTGKIIGDTFELDVIDTQYEGIHIAHICKVKGNMGNLFTAIKLNPEVKVSIDHKRREGIRRNHTATHLLHKALREILGEHIHQAGSLVAPNRLRFDYTHFDSPNTEQLSKIEKYVNDIFMQNLPVDITISSFDEAISQGAIALFGEKYGEKVRVVTVGDYSRELCAGTHLDYTGQIGLFVLLHEESIGSGMRRIEALTGEEAYKYFNSIKNRFQQLEQKLHSTGDDVLEKIEKMENQITELRRITDHISNKRIKNDAELLLNNATLFNDSKIIVSIIDAKTKEEIHAAMKFLENKIESGVIFLSAAFGNEKVSFICRITDDIINNKGLNAGDLVKLAAKITGGGGGGRPDFAQAGGKDISNINQAVNTVREKIENIFNN